MVVALVVVVWSGLVGKSEGQLANSPQPMFGHDVQHSGRSAYTADGSSAVLKWSFTIGCYIYSSPAIGSDGTVYVGSDDHKVYAINGSGALKWSFTTGDVVWSSPAIGSDGTVYVGSGDDKVYAWNGSVAVKGRFAVGGV